MKMDDVISSRIFQQKCLPMGFVFMTQHKPKTIMEGNFSCRTSLKHYAPKSCILANSLAT